MPGLWLPCGNCLRRLIEALPRCQGRVHTFVSLSVLLPYVQVVRECACESTGEENSRLGFSILRILCLFAFLSFFAARAGLRTKLRPSLATLCYTGLCNNCGRLRRSGLGSRAASEPQTGAEPKAHAHQGLTASQRVQRRPASTAGADLCALYAQRVLALTCVSPKATHPRLRSQPPPRLASRSARCRTLRASSLAARRGQ